MRVCDKCLTPKPLYRTLKDTKTAAEYDICDDCYQILTDWLHNLERKQEDDPIEQKTDRRRKK